MRNWLFHPLVFYPLAVLAAVLVILLSLEPQNWPRAAAPVAGRMVDGSLVLDGAAFNSPDKSPEQRLTVVRDFWGKALALRIAVLPGQPAPAPAEQGVRILLTPEAAAFIDDKPVSVEVTYNPLQVNPSSGLGVSLQGIGPADWALQPTPPQSGVVRFDLPAFFPTDAIGFRAITEGTDQSYGIEIVKVRVTPR